MDRRTCSIWADYDLLCKILLLSVFRNSLFFNGLYAQRVISQILNVIFAIVSQFSHDDAPEMRETTSDMYFKRAMQLLQIEILGTGSLQLIQALLIMGMYLQSTDTP